MVPKFKAEQLLALRLKIGFSRERLAATLTVLPNVVRKYELKGSDDAQYVGRLLALVESRSAIAAPALRRGWQDKPWTLAKKSPRYGHTRACFLLYMENSRDYMKALTERPVVSEHTTVWLERDNHKAAYWRKYALRPDGDRDNPDFWGILEDKYLSYW